MKPPATFTKAGIVEYPRSALEPGATGKIRVFRPPELFNKALLDSIERAPVVIGHNKGKFVDLSDHSARSVGRVLNPDINSDYAVTGKVLLTAPEALSFVDSGGGDELSIGYRFENGVKPSSRPDADYEIVPPMTINHIALTKDGRLGSEARLADSHDEGGPMTLDEFKKLFNEAKEDENKATVLFDAVEKVTKAADKLADDKLKELNDANEQKVKDAYEKGRKDGVASERAYNGVVDKCRVLFDSVNKGNELDTLIEADKSPEVIMIAALDAVDEEVDTYFQDNEPAWMAHISTKVTDVHKRLTDSRETPRSLPVKVGEQSMSAADAWQEKQRRYFYNPAREAREAREKSDK